MLNLNLYENAAEAVGLLAGEKNTAVLLAADDKNKLAKFYGDFDLSFTLLLQATYDMIRNYLCVEKFDSETMKFFTDYVTECFQKINEPEVNDAG